MAPTIKSKAKKAAPSTVSVFGKLKTQLGTIGDPLVIANVVNHIMTKRMAEDLSEALEIYADPEDKIRIMNELGFFVQAAAIGN